MATRPDGLSAGEALVKRGFDLLLASVGLLATWWLILLAALVAGGFYRQTRIGRDGRPFTIVKIRTMRRAVAGSTVSVAGDARITPIGRVLRATKIDELPQLWNVLVGEMSFVGPRPDVPGFADRLEGDDRIVLSVRPGITGPASLRYRHEERLLARIDDPERHNREVLWPDKVRINKKYVREWSLLGDLRYLWRTLVG